MITENYDTHNKDELLEEVKRRNIEGINASNNKADIIAALELSDEPEQPRAPLPKLQASTIPQIEAIPEVSNISNGGAPSDEDFVDGIFVKKEGDFANEEYALAIHEPDSYSKTHSLKNSLHFFQCTEKEFRASFEKK